MDKRSYARAHIHLVTIIKKGRGEEGNISDTYILPYLFSCRA